MKIFSTLFEKAIAWSKHQQAPKYLALLSFAESSFFPVPPDVMLAPMCLAMPAKAWRYALITTIASVLGGVLGYVIGATAFDVIQPYLQDSQYWSAFQKAEIWFNKWGVWAIFLAGFSPIPYKIFTIAAGALSMAIIPFVIASAIGRGGRFFIVAGLMKWGGAKMEENLKKYVDRIGWGSIAIAIVAFTLLR